MGNKLITVRRYLIAILLIALICFTTGPAHSSEGTVTLAAVGDVFFCRGVAIEIEEHGAGYPFEFTTDILSSYDMAFCNLECVLSDRGTPMEKRFLFRADPSNAKVLSDAGFDIISLGNNHTLDFGYLALEDTVNAVENAGMMAVGTRLVGSDDTGARFVERNGLTVGFLALSDFNEVVGETPEGYPVVTEVDPDLLPGQVSDAKSRCDVLVVSMHWGVDYINFWTERQQVLGEICIDNGADLVLGHHPHVLQDVKYYQEKPIVYSMGGFVWDSSSCGADQSAIYVFELGPSSAVVTDIIPVQIEACRPMPSI